MCIYNNSANYSFKLLKLNLCYSFFYSLIFTFIKLLSVFIKFTLTRQLRVSDHHRFHLCSQIHRSQIIVMDVHHTRNCCRRKLNASRRYVTFSLQEDDKF